MPDYKHNHYVPVWYQDRFFPAGHTGEKKFYYLDLKPEKRVSNGHVYYRDALRRLGPDNCFAQHDLYTTRLDNWESTEIEQRFFGPIDQNGRDAIGFFSAFDHLQFERETFDDLILFMSTQKLRTPKGLGWLKSTLPAGANNNQTLFALQRLQQMFGALWTEAVWLIGDASASDVKFLMSDHPITVYNAGCFPGSSWCRDFGDPDIALSGTHTLYPLSADKILILTNLSWFRHPYGNPTRLRPNPNPFRNALFDMRKIQVGRSFSRDEVLRINYIIKKRALRYVAATNESWLYPENELGKVMWDCVAENHILMPDPRSSLYSTTITIGLANGGAITIDEYGRQPGEPGFSWEGLDRDFETYHAFQAEFARLYGRRRRGRSYVFDQLCPEEDSIETHARRLADERRYKKHRHTK